jgi:hypothetical protein
MIYRIIDLTQPVENMPLYVRTEEEVIQYIKEFFTRCPLNINEPICGIQILALKDEEGDICIDHQKREREILESLGI